MSLFSFKKRTQDDDLLDGEGEAAVDFLDQPGPDQTVGVMLYGRKKYAVGLVWFAAEEENQVKLAKDRAARMGADFYCVRVSGNVQQGFGYLKRGHRIAMQTAAPIVADLMVGEWHGVFHVPDQGWWYVAVLGDMIAPQGDIFFRSESDAYTHFTAEQTKHNWPRFYAPAAWNLPGNSGEIPLSRLFDEDAKPVTLVAASLDALFSGRHNKMLAFGAAGLLTLLVLAGVVISGFDTSIFSPEQVENQAPAAPAPATSAGALQVPPSLPAVLDPALAKNLTSLAMPDQQGFLRRCMAGFNDIAMPIPGWSVATLSCENNGAQVKWNKGAYGVLTSLKTYAERLPEQTTSQFDGNATFTATIPLTAEDRAARVAVRLLQKADALLLLSNRFQRAGELTIQEVMPPVAQRIVQEASLPPEQLAEQQKEKDYVPITEIGQDDLPYFELTFRSELPPPAIDSFFAIPGLQMDSVLANFDKGRPNWLYSAKLIPVPDKRIVERYIRLQSAKQTQEKQQ